MSAQTRTISIHQWHFIMAYRHPVLCIIYMCERETCTQSNETKCVHIKMCFHSLHLIGCTHIVVWFHFLLLSGRKIICWQFMSVCFSGDVQEISVVQDKRISICCVLRMQTRLPNWPLSPLLLGFVQSFTCDAFETAAHTSISTEAEIRSIGIFINRDISQEKLNTVCR